MSIEEQLIKKIGDIKKQINALNEKLKPLRAQLKSIQLKRRHKNEELRRKNYPTLAEQAEDGGWMNAEETRDFLGEHGIKSSCATVCHAIKTGLISGFKCRGRYFSTISALEFSVSELKKLGKLTL